MTVELTNRYPDIAIGFYVDISGGYKAKWITSVSIALLFWRFLLTLKGPIRKVDGTSD